MQSVNNGVQMLDIMIRVDRLNELSRLLLEMCQEINAKKFYDLENKYRDTLNIYQLEDDLNAC